MFKFLVLALVLMKSIDTRVIREFPLTADGLELNLEVKNKDNVLWKMQIDINEKNKTVRLIRSQPKVPAVVGSVPVNSTVLPTIENRNGIVVGTCPKGYTKQGGFCFEEEDYSEEEY